MNGAETSCYSIIVAATNNVHAAPTQLNGQKLTSDAPASAFNFMLNSNCLFMPHPSTCYVPIHLDVSFIHGTYTFNLPACGMHMLDAPKRASPNCNPDAPLLMKAYVRSRRFVVGVPNF